MKASVEEANQLNHPLLLPQECLSRASSCMTRDAEGNCDDDDGNFMSLTMHDLSMRFLKADFIVVIFASVIYYTIGIAYYHYCAEFEVLDAALFSVAALTTFGYSDERLSSERDRLFSCFFMLMGVSICGTAVTILVSQVFESYQMKQKIRKKKFMTRLLMLRETRVSASDHNNPLRYSDVFLRSDALGESASNRKSLFSFDNKPHEDITLEEYIELSKLQSNLTLSKLRMEALVNVAIIISLILVGAVGFYLVEGQSVLNSVYWAVDFITTVSNGPISPATTGGKVFTIFYMLIGCFTCALAITGLANYPLSRRAVENELNLLQQFGENLTEETIFKIVNSEFFENIHGLRKDRNSLTKTEFILLLLSIMEKIDDQDVLFLTKVFRLLDRDMSGTLLLSDLEKDGQ